MLLIEVADLNAVFLLQTPNLGELVLGTCKGGRVGIWRRDG